MTYNKAELHEAAKQAQTRSVVSSSVNKIYVNRDGTNTYVGALAGKWIFNEALQAILKEYHNGGDNYSCHLHVWECSDLNSPILRATQQSMLRADSYMNEDSVLIVLERVADKIKATIC